MCEPKAGGGLGVRELSKVNLAMLAKQGWRLLNNENPLVTSIMQAKYYPNSDFLNANLGHNPSYMWRSILAAQQLVRKGSRRRIGNGEDTTVWNSPWLPCLNDGYMTTDMPPELEHVKVAGLMTVDGENWDEEVLADICNNRDRNLIRRIPISHSLNRDSWFWLQEEKGCFTVKSCYRMITGEQVCDYAGFWRKLWSLQLPGKIINLIWRVCRNCLPSAVNLARKRVQVEPRCSWCLTHEEDDTHVLFTCSFARSVWATVGITEVQHHMDEGNAVEIISKLFQNCTKEKLVLVAMVCWNLWNRRNKWVWEKVEVSVYGVQATARNMAEEWKKSRLEKQADKAVTWGSPRRWLPPPQGWIKVNIDAAVFEELGKVGVGCVVRDADGNFVCARNRAVMAFMQPREVEALSLKEALGWVKEMGYQRCIFETDAKILAEACKQKLGKAYFHTIVSDCVELVKHFENVLVEFVCKSANEVAHKLARATHSMSGIHEWFNTAPEFIHDVLVIDSI